MRKFIFSAMVAVATIFSANLFAHPNVYVFLGPPGAGKGTMCSRLSELMKIPHISTGDLLREQSKKDSELANEIKKSIASGQLVSDELILEAMKERMSQPDCENGLILDGLPRTKFQAEQLVSIFNEKDHLVFVNITIGDHVILERLQGRRTCSNCSKPFHVTFNPPKVKNQCDECKGKLIVRSDDNSDVIKKRLEIYKAQYAPIKKFLKNEYQWIELKNEVADECFAQLVDKISFVNADIDQ